MERYKRWDLAQTDINKKYNTKLTPLHVGPRELYCTPVMFAHFVFSLLSFCARAFPENPKPENPGKLFRDETRTVPQHTACSDCLTL